MYSIKNIFFLAFSIFVLYFAYIQQHRLTPAEVPMQSKDDVERVASDLLASKNLRFVSSRTLQSLWAGYGHISRIVAAPQKTKQDGTKPEEQSSFVLKYITPPHSTAPARGPPEEGHLRKLLSYQVELAFYTRLAPLLPPEVAVASCAASIHSSPSAGADVEFKTAMLLSDLRPAFPVAGERRGALAVTQVHAALSWLAGFHGFWWGHVQSGGAEPSGVDLFSRDALVRPPLVHFEEHGDAFIRSAAEDGPASVWLNGGYTYLETRRSEYAGLCEDDSSEWAEALCQPVADRGSSVAELVARVLAPRSERGSDDGALAAYQTLIHGDVKSENLFTNEKGDKVAFYDFQYVGLGIGACDLAKLFTCSVPRSMLLGTAGRSDRHGQRLPMEEGEEKLLRAYLDVLRRASGRTYEWDAFVRHWETALVDWLRFQASWGFWGNTEWLEGRVRSILADKAWVDWLLDSTK